MIDKIIYTNSRGDSIVLSHAAPYFLSNPEGFDGLESDLITTKSAYQEGISVKAVTPKERILTLNCHLLSNSEAERDRYKKKLYKVFNPLTSGTMEISTEVITRKATDLKVIQAPLFNWDYTSKNELLEFQVQILMPFPYFSAGEENKSEFGNDEGNFFFDLEIEEPGKELSIRNNSIVSNVYNTGDVKTPLRVVFRAKSNVKNPSIFNVYTKEYIKVNRSLKDGEEITVTTHQGNKRVESYFNGVTTNIFNELDPGSTFMWLEPGDNIIRYDADEMIDRLEVSIYYSDFYLGV